METAATPTGADHCRATEMAQCRRLRGIDVQGEDEQCEDEEAFVVDTDFDLNPGAGHEEGRHVFQLQATLPRRNQQAYTQAAHLLP